MKFAIFGNTYQAKKSSHAENLFRLLGQHNAQLCICREFHHFLTTDLHLNIPDAELFDGDDLSLVNLNYFYQNIPWLDEVSIGHALISDALYLGLERTVKEYKNCLR